MDILGFGAAKPPYAITQREAAMLARAFCCQTDEQARLLAALYERTRVKERGSVLLETANGAGPRQTFFPPAAHPADRGPTTAERLRRYTQDAPPLARAASQQALRASGMAPRDLTQLITVSCTGLMAPGVDLRLIKDLGLDPNVGRTHIGFMGCHGALNALRVASAFTGADPSARVLVCAVELCSLHFQYGWDAESVVANALFADGAAALVAAPAGSPSSAALRLVASGSCLIPGSEDAMTWQIGNYGFEMTLDAAVPDLIARSLRPWVVQWLAGQGLTLEQVGSWAVHPGGPRILASVATGLGLPDHVLVASRTILAESGNMSSATVLFLLDHLLRQEAPRPYVALAFGPGLAAESALFV